LNKKLIILFGLATPIFSELNQDLKKAISFCSHATSKDPNKDSFPFAADGNLSLLRRISGIDQYYFEAKKNVLSQFTMADDFKKLEIINELNANDAGLFILKMAKKRLISREIIDKIETLIISASEITDIGNLVEDVYAPSNDSLFLKTIRLNERIRLVVQEFPIEVFINLKQINFTSGEKEFDGRDRCIGTGTIGFGLFFELLNMASVGTEKIKFNYVSLPFLCTGYKLGSNPLEYLDKVATEELEATNFKKIGETVSRLKNLKQLSFVGCFFELKNYKEHFENFVKIHLNENVLHDPDNLF
jgi:hypothetical protein